MTLIKGELTYSWDSVLSSFDGSTLEYLYRTTTVEKGFYSGGLGFQSESFERRTATRAPNSSTGRFVDFSDPRSASITRGARITPDEAQRCRLDREFLKELVDQKLGLAFL